MHGHCVHRLDIVESARQNKTHATLAVVARKGDTQYVLACLGPLALRQFERNANVAVHQAQAVVVASHQHRPAFVPLLIAVDQPGLEQGVGDSLIQAFDTPRPFAYSAQQLEGIEGLQHLPRPLSPAFVIKGAVNGWSLVAQQTQVMPITRSEEHTSELQSLRHLVCRLLLETNKTSMRTIVARDKKNNNARHNSHTWCS